MPLFGPKCGRCGRRTRHSYKGAPTCELCTQEVETRLRAEQEETRSCPLDKTSMEKEVVHGIIIDRCPQCRGVWLDRGELELVGRVVEARAARQLLVGMSYV